jgi:hypothetical protein
LRKQGKLKEVESVDEALAVLRELGIGSGGRNRSALIGAVAEELNCDFPELDVDTNFLNQAQQLLQEKLKEKENGD